MEISDDQILDSMTEQERKRVERRVRFNKMVEEVYAMADELGVKLSDVSRACGYAPYTLTSGISQSKTTGRINMKIVTRAHARLSELKERQDTDPA